MQVNWKVLVTVVVATAVGFVFESAGPVGMKIWPMPDSIPKPEGTNLILLMFEGVLEAVAFGVGVAFLIFGYPAVKKLTQGGTGYTTMVYLSAAWMLVNWVPHTALHMHHGNLLKPEDFTGLVYIEYGFHVTLMISGAFFASFILRTARGRATAAGTSTPKGTASTA